MQQTLPWILASLSLVLLLCAAGLWLMNRRRPRSRPLPTEWTLTARPVFSSDERRVYRHLREALPHHIVLSKLPLLRFSQPTDPAEVRFWYTLLGSTHVTFAICSANGRVLAAIDLDHDRGDTRRVMQIKQSVLAACRVRYLRCSVDNLPSVAELQLMVPQTGGSAARGPQPAPTVGRPRESRGSAGPSSRRRERTPLWQDSGFMQDSFFGVEGRAGEVGGSAPLGRPRRGSPGHDDPGGPDLPDAGDDFGGVVIDTPTAPARH